MPLGEAINSALGAIKHDYVELLQPAEPRTVGNMFVVDLDKVRLNGKPRDCIMKNFQCPLSLVRTDPLAYVKKITLEAQDRRDKNNTDRVCCLVIENNPRVNGFKFVTRSERFPSEARTITTDFEGSIISDSDNPQV